MSFGIKSRERHPKSGQFVDVWQNPKFVEGVKTAQKLIEGNKYGLTEADFWILKTFNQTGCQYAGLIISHNGCLKINDSLPKEQKFVPSCVTWVKNMQGDLVLQYLNDYQGILEFGEASIKNCQNAYPFAMVLKRLQDRVILKNSKIAFSGIMSEVESDEFKEPVKQKNGMITDEQIDKLTSLGCDLSRVAAAYKVDNITQLTEKQAADAIKIKEGGK